MNEMVIFYVLFSITVVLFILLLLTFFSWERWKTNFRKELAFRPADVSDYTIPRYVYANGSESPEYEPENGRIVGYRIAPNLVINSHIYTGTSLRLCQNYMLRHLLQEKDVLLLEENLNALHSLRAKSGEKPLSFACFWAKKNGFPVIINLEKNQYWTVSDEQKAYPAILKY